MEKPDIPLIDIRPDHWEIVRGILHKHVPQYEVWAFGSRAKWTAKPFSDLDLAVVTDAPLNTSVMGALADDFSESDLPWKVDVVDWAATSDVFQKIIERDKVAVQRPLVMSDWPSPTVEQLLAWGVIERPMDGNHGSIHPKTADFVPSGIPFIMASDLKDGRVDFDRCSFITEKQARSLQKGFSKTGDVLLSHKATIGRTAIVQENDYPFLMLTPQITYYRVKDKARLNNFFLRYYFESRPFKDIFESWAGGGSTRAYLGITAQLKLPISLPPIDVQKRIVDLIRPLDEKIELNRQMNETLESMARAIFKDWFVDFGPTRAKMAGAEPYLAPEIWNLFPDRLDDEGKPNGWNTQPLTGLIDLIGGGTPKTSVEEYWQGDIPWFSVTDVPSPSDVFVVSTDKSISKAGLDSCSSKLLPVGTTIITARGTVGKLALVGSEMAMNQSCYGITGKHDWPDYFVHFLVKTAILDLQARTHGSVFDTITRDTFESVVVVQPTPAQAHAFEASVTPLLQRIHSNLKETATLAATRDLLLPKLMSGEIRVRDVEPMTKTALARAS